MRHVQEQNWFAVGIDFMIVVIGVFIGIQVANWNEAQSDRRDYYGALDRLRGEIEANLGTLELVDGDVAAELPFVRDGLDALETCADDSETRQVVNRGVGLLSGTSGLKLNDQSLVELTTAPRMLAQQSPTMRSRLAELHYYQELAETQATFYEDMPLANRPERIQSLRPGPRQPTRATYLGITYDGERRLLQLAVPVSIACKDGELVAALWAWDRWQSGLSFLTQKMRSEYHLTLERIDEARP